MRPLRTSVQIATLHTMSALNAIEPASDNPSSSSTGTLNTESLNDDGSTFSYFRDYRAKAEKNSTSSKCNESKEHMQQKCQPHSQNTLDTAISRYNPVNLPIISHGTNDTDYSKDLR
ncbi:MAG: hypothetical protein KAJ40_02400 [Alphaproteobacteria bacterium]|nr:hypothetical protein [Alphaproteobacteria bacterium]